MSIFLAVTRYRKFRVGAKVKVVFPAEIKQKSIGKKKEKKKS